MRKYHEVRSEYGLPALERDDPEATEALYVLAGIAVLAFFGLVIGTYIASGVK